MKDTVAIYSGGMDSFTLVNRLLDEGRLHSCISFFYGQRHRKELDYARGWCMKHAVPHHVVDLYFFGKLLKGSALTDESVAVPHGHYAEATMKATVVPNRNMVMLSIAAAYAIAEKASRVAYGAHSGDHDIYPDCREEFVNALERTIGLADWHQVQLYVPYLHGNKETILHEGLSAYQLDYSQSWTCYEGGAIACGKCGSCQERLAAFAALGVADPLPYVTRELLEKEGV
jgi:7-cyano-7-deazaguanine synthase